MKKSKKVVPDTVNPKTGRYPGFRHVVVRFETDLTPEQLHEALCVGIYENVTHIRSGWLMNHVPDIQLMKDVTKKKK